MSMVIDHDCFCQAKPARWRGANLNPWETLNRMPLLKKLTGVAPRSACRIRSPCNCGERSSFIRAPKSALAKATTDGARNSEQSAAEQDEAAGLRSCRRLDSTVEIKSGRIHVGLVDIELQNVRSGDEIS